MEIGSQTIAALTWTLTDSMGEVLDELDEPVEFLVGGSDLLATIDEALLGHRAGEGLDLHLEPEQAFGDYNDKLVFLEARQRFPDGIEEGMSFEGLPEGCSPDAPTNLLYTVTEIYPDHVVVDGNHPLAGISLRLKLKVVSVRQASTQEIEAGSAGSTFFSLPAMMPGSATRH